MTSQPNLNRSRQPRHRPGTCAGHRTVIYSRNGRNAGLPMSMPARMRRVAERWGEQV